MAAEPVTPPAAASSPHAAQSPAVPAVAEGQGGRGCQYPTPGASSAGDRRSPHAAAPNGEVGSIAAPPPLRLVFWELTARCNLACRHCRAEAREAAVAGELTSAEVCRVAADIRSAADPILVLTGGEPLARPDLFDLARTCTQLFSRVALATNGTLVDDAVARRLVETGIRRVSVSLDGASAATHDAFRGQTGCFAAALGGLEALRRAGASLQVNATVTRHNDRELPQLLDLARSCGAEAFHVFMLVPVGCGAEISEDQRLSPQRFEEVLIWLAEQTLELRGRLQIKATCAPQYYRILRDLAQARGVALPGHPGHPNAVKFLAAPSVADGQVGRGCQDPTPVASLAGDRQSPRAAKQNGKLNGIADHPGGPGGAPGLHAFTRGCLAGSGVCFISRTGEVQPCGYLPLSVGNLRSQSLGTLWREAEIFAALRDPSRLRGKCGACGYRVLCQGCRARAYALTGDYLGAEPDCPYEPKGWSAGAKP